MRKLKTSPSSKMKKRFVGSSEPLDPHRQHARWRWRGPGVPRSGAMRAKPLEAANVTKEFDRGSG